MPHFEFIWDDEPNGNVDKCAQHGLTQDDVENVFASPTTRTRSRSSGLPLWKGRSLDGREVAVVFEWIDEVTVFPITAFVPED